MFLTKILVVVAISCVLIIISWLKRLKKENKSKNVIKLLNCKEIPIVQEGNYMWIGNGISFGKDIIGFIRNAYKKYGPVFSIQIFRKKIIVICDRNLLKEFFKAKENDLSLYKVLSDLYFGQAFSDDPNSLPIIIQMVKKNVQIKYHEFVPKIVYQAKKMIVRLKEKSLEINNKIELSQEMIRFVANTSAQCFIGIEISERFYNYLLNFTKILNEAVKMTYFFPISILRIFINPFLRYYRHKMISELNNIIEQYRNNKEYAQSSLIRKAVDQNLNNKQIGEIIICLLYVSSENTALGLTASLIDLCCSEKWWKIINNLSQDYIKNDNWDGLLKNIQLDNCIYESARLNTHIFPLNRQATINNKNATLGPYYVGDADVIGVCEPMLMVYEAANDIFKDSLNYNPSRFESPLNESKQSIDLQTWGSGIHLCPGKMFAIYEIKIAMALITQNFERFQLCEKEIGKLDYFSPSAFAERKVSIKFVPLVHEKTIKCDNNNLLINHNHNNSSLIKLQNYDQLQHIHKVVWIWKNAINEETQIRLYYEMINASKNSNEQKMFKENKVPLNQTFPLTYHNLIYTNTSNCDENNLTLCYQLSQNVWNYLCLNKDIYKFTGSSNTNFNSIYCQLFDQNATMKEHYDEYVSWGVSISLGSSCEFKLDNQTIILNSGDIMIADFSMVKHGITKIDNQFIPDWFDDGFEFYDNNNNKCTIQTFGRARCSIQIRDISNITNGPQLSIENFYNYLS